jgi:hypothetical protein
MYVDFRKSERKLEVGQQVYLRLQPYRHILVVTIKALKLSPRFYGPFAVIHKIEKVVYELDLQFSARIHLVFSCISN